ncbi:MAG: folylpolyglutamate synthase/dihydrofolate synthase family protein [Tissierellaceae bacterium]
MRYEDALNYINDKDKFGSRLGLSSIGRLLELLDNPQDRLKIIHIAGTNGKGSTSSYLANCIMEAGYSVGLFTSPYLERFNERIQLNGMDISDEDLGRITSLVKTAADQMVKEGLEHPTTFEIITAIAFVYYSQENPDYVILEVGLGGRFDSTNIIRSSIASVITTIDFDHIKELGDTLDKIAYQKAGIIKRDGLVISYPQRAEAEKVLKDVAKDMNADIFFSEKSDVDVVEESEFGSVFNYHRNKDIIRDIRISMIGEYQIYNASLAITTLMILRERGLLDIDNDNILDGILKTKWKGRLEILKKSPRFLIDGAHNVQGIENLKKALELFEYRNLILGIGILKDKDVDHMVDTLIPLADKVIVTEVNMPRKLDAELLAEKVEKYHKEVYIERDIKKAVDKSISIAHKDDLIVFGGSLYLIGEVRTLVNLL